MEVRCRSRGLAYVAAAIARCLRRDAKERFPSLAELADVIAPFGGTSAKRSRHVIARALAGVKRPSTVEPPPLATAVDSTAALAATLPELRGTTGGAQLREQAAVTTPRRRGGLVWITRASSWFGSSIALSGDTIAVGAKLESSNATGVNGDQSNTSMQGAGAAYVFTRANGIWAQQAYLKASNTQNGTRFGAAIALSGDVIAVGSPDESSSATGIDGDDGGITPAQSAGAVYVFSRSGATWSPEAFVKPKVTRPGMSFGWAVALSRLPSQVLAVGAVGDQSGAIGINGNRNDTSAAAAGATHTFP